MGGLNDKRHKSMARCMKIQNAEDGKHTELAKMIDAYSTFISVNKQSEDSEKSKTDILREVMDGHDMHVIEYETQAEYVRTMRNLSETNSKLALLAVLTDKNTHLETKHSFSANFLENRKNGKYMPSPYSGRLMDDWNMDI
jgi:hypothetical protein